MNSFKKLVIGFLIVVAVVIMQVRTATTQISMDQQPQPIIPHSNNRNNNLTGTVQLLTPHKPYIPPVEQNSSIRKQMNIFIYL
jgi:hypothetical protein